VPFSPTKFGAAQTRRALDFEFLEWNPMLGGLGTRQTTRARSIPSVLPAVTIPAESFITADRRVTRRVVNNLFSDADAVLPESRAQSLRTCRKECAAVADSCFVASRLSCVIGTFARAPERWGDRPRRSVAPFFALRLQNISGARFAIRQLGD
jgi:hypothetical protein